MGGEEAEKAIVSVLPAPSVDVSCWPSRRVTAMTGMEMGVAAQGRRGGGKAEGLWAAQGAIYTALLKQIQFSQTSKLLNHPPVSSTATKYAPSTLSKSSTAAAPASCAASAFSEK